MHHGENLTVPSEATDTVTGQLLVVDDAPTVAATIATLLRRQGYGVSVFTCPRAALSAFARQPSTFDAVITDECMPGMTGMRFIARLRELRPDLNVVLISGHDLGEHCKRPRTWFLQKPFSGDEMGRLLGEVLTPGPQGRLQARC